MLWRAVDTMDQKITNFQNYIYMESRKNEVEELYTDHQKAILATWLGHVAIENSRNLDSSSISFLFAWSKKIFSWYKTILSIE